MDESKEDLIVECLSECQVNFKNRQLLQKDVQEFFCARCRNDGCTQAGHGETAWIRRMATQVDRFFHTDVSDPNLPQYRALMDKEFADMTQHAMRLIVSGQRGDWEIPDTTIPIPSQFKVVEAPTETEATPEEIEAATRSMPPSPEDFFMGDDDGEDAPFGEAETVHIGEEPLYPDFVGNLADSNPIPENGPSIRAQLAKPPEQKPRTGNVERRSGIMLRGAEPPSLEPEPDPWEVPAHLSPGAKKLNVGGTFTFGSNPDQTTKEGE